MAHFPLFSKTTKRIMDKENSFIWWIKLLFDKYFSVERNSFCCHIYVDFGWFSAISNRLQSTEPQTPSRKVRAWFLYLTSKSKRCYNYSVGCCYSWSTYFGVFSPVKSIFIDCKYFSSYYVLSNRRRELLF